MILWKTVPCAGQTVPEAPAKKGIAREERHGQHRMSAYFEHTKVVSASRRKVAGNYKLPKKRPDLYTRSAGKDTCSIVITVPSKTQPRNKKHR